MHGIRARSPWSRVLARCRARCLAAMAQAEVRPETVAAGLAHPWAVAFVDGRFLVTERAGRMRVVEAAGQVGPPLRASRRSRRAGRAACWTWCPIPASPRNRTLYFCFSEPGAGRQLARHWPARGCRRTARASRTCASSSARSRRWRASTHFGCRIVEARDGNLFLTLGERFSRKEDAQTLDNHLGKVCASTKDGAPAPGQPVRRPGRRAAGDLELRPPQRRRARRWRPDGALLDARARPAGRRRDQRAAGRPQLRLAGDHLRRELRRRQDRRGHHAARPAWSSRCTTGCRRSRPRAWRSSPATAMAPAWQGNLFVGSLKFGYLDRIDDRGRQGRGREQRLLQGIGRVRDVRQGPDGLLYLLTDEQRRQAGARAALAGARRPL